MSTIGERIREARKKIGLTMRDLHDLTGLSTGNISDMENNKFSPSVSSLIPLSQALNCSIDWLATGREFTRNIEVRDSDQKLSCDGVPLNENEMDMIAMYRCLDDRDRGDVFDSVNLKYEKATGKRASIYSTYSDTKERQDGGPQNMNNTGSGIA